MLDITVGCSECKVRCVREGGRVGQMRLAVNRFS